VISNETDSTSNKQTNTLIDINIAKLLKKLEEIVTCPISHMRIKEPLCDPDLYTYENHCITEWLSTRDTSPMTRIPMTIHNMIGNNGIRDLNKAMDEFKIGSSVIKRVHRVLESKDTKPIIETLSKA
jgi:hypothetical protein